MSRRVLAPPAVLVAFAAILASVLHAAPASRPPSTAGAPKAAAKPSADVGPAEDGPRVLDVVAERATIHAGRPGETAVWRYRTTVAGRATASIYDARDVLVRTIEAGQNLPAGDHRLTWDGRDDQGREAPPGYYLLVLESSVAGRTARYDPSDSTGGELTQASAARYDCEAGLVRYAVTRPALLRVQLGLRKDGPLLRTLADWVARDAGEHAESWDGWDSSGVIPFGGSADLDVQIWAYALPVNAVVVAAAEPAGTKGAKCPGKTDGAAASSPGPQKGARVPERPAYLEFAKDRARRARAEARPHEMYNHWQHDRLRCHNPGAILSVAAGRPRGAEPVSVDAPLPLKLELPADEAAFVQEERFETVIYVDGVFAFEEEQGYLPFTWTLEPAMLTSGEHVVTFMVRGYEGHFGSSSIRVSRPQAAGSPAVGR